MRTIPKPHQPPHLLSFGILMFVYRKENNAVQMKVCQNFTINFINHLSNRKINDKIDGFGCTIKDANVLSEGPKVAIFVRGP